jgi:hypothetical protein
MSDATQYFDDIYEEGPMTDRDDNPGRRPIILGLQRARKQRQRRGLG